MHRHIGIASLLLRVRLEGLGYSVLEDTRLLTEAAPTPHRDLRLTQGATVRVLAFEGKVPPLKGYTEGLKKSDYLYLERFNLGTETGPFVGVASGRGYMIPISVLGSIKSLTEFRANSGDEPGLVRLGLDLGVTPPAARQQRTPRKPRAPKPQRNPRKKK